VAVSVGSTSSNFRQTLIRMPYFLSLIPLVEPDVGFSRQGSLMTFPLRVGGHEFISDLESRNDPEASMRSASKSLLTLPNWCYGTVNNQVR